MEWLKSLIDTLVNIDPATVQGWIAVLGGLLALTAHYREQKDQGRWSRIRSVIPDAHRLAQKAAALTKTRKDDEFLRIVERLLEPFGVELSRKELESVRSMGSAEHQTFKLLRDGPEASGVAEVAYKDPLEGPGSISPVPGPSSTVSSSSGSAEAVAPAG